MVIACCIKARQGIFYRGNISRGNQKERLPRHRTKDEFESTKQWVYPPWMWGLRGYGRKTPSTFDSNSSFSYYRHCRYHSYISCHCCHELACDDRRQNESSAESSQVKHYTRLASLNRFNCPVLVQPLYVALMRTILLDGTSSASCALQVLTRVLCSVGVSASLIHMALISGGRFLAMRRPFALLTLVTDSSLLAASVLAWLLSIILHIPLAVNKSAFFPIKNTFVGLCIVFIIFCHVTVYREIRRHENQIAAQQVTVKAREQFEKDKKAFKATFIVIVLLMLCYFPILIFRAVLIRYRTKISSEVLYIYLFLTTLMAFLNSLLNPVIYSFRLREFRLAFIKLIFNSSAHCRGWAGLDSLLWSTKRCRQGMRKNTKSSTERGPN